MQEGKIPYDLRLSLRGGITGIADDLCSAAENLRALMNETEESQVEDWVKHRNGYPTPDLLSLALGDSSYYPTE
jgi:hypothetical protein